MNVEYLSIIFADYFTLINLSTSLHFVQTRYAAPTFIRISWKRRKRLLHINEELLVKWQNMLLIFQKFTSHWSRLTKPSSGMLLEPRRSL